MHAVGFLAAVVNHPHATIPTHTELNLWLSPLGSPFPLDAGGACALVIAETSFRRRNAAVSCHLSLFESLLWRSPNALPGLYEDVHTSYSLGGVQLERDRYQPVSPLAGPAIPVEAPPT